MTGATGRPGQDVATASAAPSPPRVLQGVRRYAAPLAIYAATRAIAAMFVILTAPRRVVRLEDLDGYHSTVPAALPADYGTVMTSWDAQWYWDVVLHGYVQPVVDGAGHPVQSSLAFYPLYPLLVKAVMALTGLGFEVAAPTTSLLVGAAGVAVVYRLVEVCLDRRRALGAVAMLCCFISAPILQAAYTESLALLLIATGLLLLRRRRYLLVAVTVLLLGLTRNIALTFLPVVLVHGLVREHQHRAGSGDRPPRWTLGLLALVPLVGTAAWPVLAGLVSGRADAYLTTIQAWPGFTGSALRPPWAQALTESGVGGWVAAVVLLGILALLLSTASVRGWGPELWAWTASLIGFVLLTTSATTSLARYLLLAFPLGLVLMPRTDEAGGRRAQNVVVVLACASGLALQLVWVDKILVFAGSGGGWGFP